MALRTIVFFGLLCLLAGPTRSRAEEKTPTKAKQASPKSSSRKQVNATPHQKALLISVDLSAWEVTKGLDKIVQLPTKKGNAADHYAKLESLYAEDREDPKEVTVSPKGKGIKEILLGATYQKCRLTPDYYPLMTKGTVLQPDMIVFQAYLFALLERAKELEDDGNTKAADLVYRSGLIWGWHMSEDRSSLVPMLLGVSILTNTAKQYSRFLQRQLDLRKSKQVLEFYNYMLRIRKRTALKARAHLGEFSNFACLLSTARVATEDPEAFWRQEAVLRLGVFRHGAPTADGKDIVHNQEFQKIAEETLIHVAENDKHEWIRKLAQWSIENVTPERFKDMRKITMFDPLKVKADKDKKTGK